jgi:hypothetical protein
MAFLLPWHCRVRNEIDPGDTVDDRRKSLNERPNVWSTQVRG